MRWNSSLPARHAPIVVDVKHVTQSIPSPSRFHLLLPTVTRITHFAFQSIGGEDERRRRRRRRKSRRHSRPSVVLAGPEHLSQSAYRLKVMLPPTLKILACIFSPALRVRCFARDSSRFRRVRDAPAFPPAAESCACRFRWHWEVSSPPRWRSRRCGSACPEPHSGCALGFSHRFFYLIVAHCFELLFAVSAGRILAMNYKS